MCRATTPGVVQPHGVVERLVYKIGAPTLTMPLPKIFGRVLLYEVDALCCNDPLTSGVLIGIPAVLHRCHPVWCTTLERPASTTTQHQWFVGTSTGFERPQAREWFATAVGA